MCAARFCSSRMLSRKREHRVEAQQELGALLVVVEHVLLVREQRPPTAPARRRLAQRGVARPVEHAEAPEHVRDEARRRQRAHRRLAREQVEVLEVGAKRHVRPVQQLHVARRWRCGASGRRAPPCRRRNTPSGSSSSTSARASSSPSTVAMSVAAAGTALARRLQQLDGGDALAARERHEALHAAVDRHAERQMLLRDVRGDRVGLVAVLHRHLAAEADRAAVAVGVLQQRVERRRLGQLGMQLCAALSRRPTPSCRSAPRWRRTSRRCRARRTTPSSSQCATLRAAMSSARVR
jgi:hypothetical protein